MVGAKETFTWESADPKTWEHLLLLTNFLIVIYIHNPHCKNYLCCIAPELKSGYILSGHGIRFTKNVFELYGVKIDSILVQCTQHD